MEPAVPAVPTDPAVPQKVPTEPAVAALPHVAPDCVELSAPSGVEAAPAEPTVPPQAKVPAVPQNVPALPTLPAVPTVPPAWVELSPMPLPPSGVEAAPAEPTLPTVKADPAVPQTEQAKVFGGWGLKTISLADLMSRRSMSGCSKTGFRRSFFFISLSARDF